ncbi:MAG: hypothetical protein F6J95_017175 [Leptolyngbya sp. SIO1E4]|nr:hypothetical protein [Leptolyngbya sp. SIO1E4]
MESENIVCKMAESLLTGVLSKPTRQQAVDLRLFKFLAQNLSTVIQPIEVRETLSGDIRCQRKVWTTQNQEHVERALVEAWQTIN